MSDAPGILENRCRSRRIISRLVRASRECSRAIASARAGSRWAIASMMARWWTCDSVTISRPSFFWACPRAGTAFGEANGSATARLIARWIIGLFASSTSCPWKLALRTMVITSRMRTRSACRRRQPSSAVRCDSASRPVMGIDRPPSPRRCLAIELGVRLWNPWTCSRARRRAVVDVRARSGCASPVPACRRRDRRGSGGDRQSIFVTRRPRGQHEAIGVAPPGFALSSSAVCPVGDTSWVALPPPCRRRRSAADSCRRDARRLQRGAAQAY